MAAAAASLAAMFPARRVERGYQDPAVLGDDALLQGVYTLIAGGASGWAEFVGREGQFGTVEFAIVGWCKVAGETDSLALEQMEAELEGELLTWCQTIKTGPLLDAVYPRRVAYSGGIECPYGWVVMQLEAGYV